MVRRHERTRRGRAPRATGGAVRRGNAPHACGAARRWRLDGSVGHRRGDAGRIARGPRAPRGGRPHLPRGPAPGERIPRAAGGLRGRSEGAAPLRILRRSRRARRLRHGAAAGRDGRPAHRAEAGAGGGARRASRADGGTARAHPQNRRGATRLPARRDGRFASAQLPRRARDAARRGL